jgi:hypothetical protein
MAQKSTADKRKQTLLTLKQNLEVKKGMLSDRRRASLMAEFNSELCILYDIITMKTE